MTKNLNETKNPTPTFNSSYSPTLPASHDMDNFHVTPIQDEDLGLNLQLSENSEEFYVTSESEYEWESEDEIEGELGINVNVTQNENVSKNNNITLSASEGALVPVVDEDDDEGEDIGSDEERDILKGIKDEIEQKVREEMKSELAIYKEKLKAIENGQLDDGNVKDEKKDEDLEGLDPKIKEALIKMRKLDRILSKKLKREKEVKRDRLLLEKRMREEIEELKTVGKEHKESKTNTEKYLSLTLPPSHNEGIVIDNTPVTPVFQTQVDEADVMEGGKKNGRESGETSGKNSKSSLNDTESSHSMDNNSKKKKRKKKDFIKRNKELAAQAEEGIAMTEEEKKRVSSLLSDLDALSDLPEDDDTPFSVEDNPFQISVHQGGGFLPDNIELRSLASIDGQLKNIMPSEDYESLMSGAISHAPQHKLFTRVDVKTVLNCERYGERALLETKEQREMNEKLKVIEEELAKFTLPNEMKLETPSLSGDQLNDLLDQCARTMSRVSSVPDLESLPETTPRSIQSTSRSSIYENPPVLPHDVLQKLLAEAYCPISSKLTSVAEMEEGSEQDEELEPISAETWKVIAEQEINESDIKNLQMAENSAKNIPYGYTVSQQSRRDEFNQNLKPNSDQFKTEYKGKIPFLPEINKSPFLISQGLNNEQSLRASSRSEWTSASNQNSIEIMRNSLQDSNMVVESFSDFGDTREATPTPRPPSCDKRPFSNQSNRSIRSTATNN